METTQKPQYIQGHFRYKTVEVESTKKQDGGVIIGLLMIGMSIALLAVMLWQFTILLTASTGAGIVAKKYFQHKNDPDRLVINHY
jgi:hypothetical protein